MLEIQNKTRVFRPDGGEVLAKENMEYLGTVLYADSSQGHELNRRIGRAKSDFLVLAKLINKKTKIKIN